MENNFESSLDSDGIFSCLFFLKIMESVKDV